MERSRRHPDRDRIFAVASAGTASGFCEIARSVDG
eukprot:gene13516-biopygen69